MTTAPNAETARPALSILRVEASGRREGSRSRLLTGRLIDRLVAAHPGAEIVTRDLADGIPFVDDAWIAAKSKAPEDRNAKEQAAMSTSEALIDELRAADVLVLGTPIYNYGMPAALKAWIDQVVRNGITFATGPDGTVGYLSGRKVYVAVASGGTELGGARDYFSEYLRFILSLVGMHDITFIAGDALSRGGEAKLQGALEAVDALDFTGLRPVAGERH